MTVPFPLLSIQSRDKSGQFTASAQSVELDGKMLLSDYYVVYGA